MSTFPQTLPILGTGIISALFCVPSIGSVWGNVDIYIRDDKIIVINK
jgi:predicted membrane protein